MMLCIFQDALATLLYFGMPHTSTLIHGTITLLKQRKVDTSTSLKYEKKKKKILPKDP